MNQQQRQPTQEEDIRLKMLNSFMTCPHRDTVELNKLHAELQEKDPLFYVHLAAWYQRHGDLRDHKEIFSARLITDIYLPNREAGLALFQKHPFFLKFKIFNFIKGKDVKIRTKTGKKIVVEIKNKKKTVDEVKIDKKHVGLDKNIPSSFLTELSRYLNWLEANPEQFDTVAMRNASDLKALYVNLRFKHSKRTNDILFEKKYPKNSKMASFKAIIEAKDPTKQAEMIVKEKIPFTTAIGLVEDPTPAVWVALIDAMSPQEAINHVATFEEKGLLDNVATKDLIMKKLKKAETTKTVSALKSKAATATGRIKNEEVVKQMDNIADKQIKKGGVIRVSTAICVDKSGSMTRAIQVGKNVAALVSGATEAPLHVFAFDQMVYPIVSREQTLTGWEAAFRPIIANGRTCMSSCADYLIKKNILVEQFVFITDEGETDSPTFASKYLEYKTKFNTSPHVVIVHVEGGERSSTLFSDRLKQAGIEFDTYTPKEADYYSLPGLIPLLARKTKLDLLYEIMDTPLPARKVYA
jgi:hypothetical protein